MKRNILLCVAGATPAIITETLFALTRQEKPSVTIDEIRVITTLEGRDKILSALLEKDTGAFYRFCEDFRLAADSILFDETRISLLRTRDGRILEDIRTTEENELAGDQICEIVRELCNDGGTRIFASAAGGRKTMSIYLTLAMSLFGRAEDSLSHVLVNADFENNRNFFYPPATPKIIDSFNPQTKETKKVSTADARIYLAPIRFPRLCGIGSENEKFGKARKYGEIVTEAQKVLDIREKEYDLLIDVKKQTAFVRGQRVKLTPREFFFYLIFIKKRLSGKEIVSLNDLTAEDFDMAFSEILLSTESEDVNWKFISRFPKYNFAEVMLGQLEFARNADKAEKERAKEFKNFRDAFSKVVTLIGKKFTDKGVDDRYFLVSTDDGTASYRLTIAPEKIKINESENV